MYTTLDFAELLRLIDERSTAFRAAVDSAPSLDVQVPTCPEWTLLDLVRHIGEGRRRWAAIVAAGPADTQVPTESGGELPEDLSGWLAESTRLLVDALREAGPDQGCWTWWPDSQSPQTAGAVARHQLQQMAIHTYDAQLTVGKAEPLDVGTAVDGVAEFLTTCCATRSPWPHAPASLDFRVREGGAWRLLLSGEGARVVVADEAGATASVGGSAEDVVLWLHGRVELEGLEVAGEGRVFEQLRDWEPEG